MKMFQWQIVSLFFHKLQFFFLQFPFNMYSSRRFDQNNFTSFTTIYWADEMSQKEQRNLIRN